MRLDAGQASVLRLRLCDTSPEKLSDPFSDFEQAFDARLREANEFYRAVTPASASEDAAHVMRQGLAGMLWTKKYYFFDADKWLDEHGVDPFAVSGPPVRNHQWVHMVNNHVISMPDKWEYPWYPLGISRSTLLLCRR